MPGKCLCPIVTTRVVSNKVSKPKQVISTKLSAKSSLMD